MWLRLMSAAAAAPRTRFFVESALNLFGYYIDLVFLLIIIYLASRVSPPITALLLVLLLLRGVIQVRHEERSARDSLPCRPSSTGFQDTISRRCTPRWRSATCWYSTDM